MVFKRKFLLKLLCILLCLAPASAYAQAEIVVIVNNEVITRKDLNDFTNFTRMQYSENYQGRELQQKIDSLKPGLLDKLIEDSLILQEAKKKGIVIDEARIRDRITEIKKKYNGDAEFQRMITKEGLVQADLETRIRNQMLMLVIVQREVRDKIIIRPDEVTAFYNRNLTKFSSPEQRQLLVITLDNRDLAQSFSYHFKTGQKLEDLATRYPITVNQLTAERGESLRKEIEEVVFKMGIGEISKPVEIDKKYYIFKLEHIIPPRKLTLAEAQDEINSYLYEKKMQEAFDKWLAELKKRSYIKIIKE